MGMHRSTRRTREVSATAALLIYDFQHKAGQFREIQRPIYGAMIIVMILVYGRDRRVEG
jgi:hypothetical protein